ncbi:Aminopeptidase 2 mitochondrial [Coemansia javaensis]|uniref:Aminopeptidase n=1 Tax=Coemansia javaensis TaxID=2761396 RepID=A0A9W8H2A4_9FUNG|nr:Aminopeptidase 2 mitochondrial [Coemansia javaensis]
MALKPDVSALGGEAEAAAGTAAAAATAAANGGGGGASSKERRGMQGGGNHAGHTGGSGPADGACTDGGGIKAQAQAAGTIDADDNDLLPTTVSPAHYDIHLRPDMADGRVPGTVAIDATVNEPTAVIVLHAKCIDIESAAVYAHGCLVAECAGVDYNAALETAAIRLTSAVGVGRIQLRIAFVARLSSGMYGLYRCKYRDRSGQPAHMLVTQFQAKCARLVFPCWDEPAIKAEFTLALAVPESHTALSNMPVAADTVCAGTRTVVFCRSPRMSTYLLALASGELDYIEATARAGPVTTTTTTTTTSAAAGEREPIVCRVYTPPADIDKVQFSLDTAVRVLERLVDVFGYEYPLPKLDLVAVPELEAGGMENWGLVFFRTVRLFITHQTSLWIRQKAVYVIAHELSHQWFGNLVTMAWWDDLWLNEGFATWIGIYITDQLYPEWRRWDHFTIEDRQAALSADSLRSSHPIHVKIKGSADIDQVFDSITYYKGCSLIRMLSAHLGIDVFMAGVRAYLVAHEYSTATTADLWRALERVSGQDVARMMHSWTTHVGYPVVTVDEDFGTGRLALAQHRYLHSGRPAPEDDRVVWWIPLGLVSSATNSAGDNGGVVRAIMHERSGGFAIPGGPAARWFKLNYDNAGLYRVCYSPAALQRLAEAFRRGEVRSVDMVGVLNDMVALVTSGYMRTSTLLDMVGHFRDASGYAVWQIIGYFLEMVFVTWADTSEALGQHVLALARSLFAPKAQSLGWTQRAGDSPPMARLRTVSIPRAAWAGDPAVISRACQLFAQFYHSPETKPFHHDFTASVLEIAVRDGPDANYDRVREMYEDGARWQLSEDHRMAALGALACSRNAHRVEQTLEYALSDHVLPQDLNIVIGFMVSSNHTSKHMLWRWFCANYHRVVARLGECSALLGHVVGTVIGEFASDEMAAEIERWFADKHTAAFDRTIPQSLEFIRVRAAWLRRDHDDVADWFQDHPAAIAAQ